MNTLGDNLHKYVAQFVFATFFSPDVVFSPITIATTIPREENGTRWSLYFTFFITTFFLRAEHQGPDTTALHTIFSEMDRTNNRGRGESSHFFLHFANKLPSPEDTALSTLKSEVMRWFSTNIVCTKFGTKFWMSNLKWSFRSVLCLI